jgi:hypothetical protein
MHDPVGGRSVRTDLALCACRGYESRRVVAPAPSYNADVPRSVGAVDTAVSDIKKRKGRRYVYEKRSPCAVSIRPLIF